MDSSTATLPIIDISPFLNPESSLYNKLNTAKQIAFACEHVGFFYITGHHIQDQGEPLKQLVREFFALPNQGTNRILQFI